MTGYLILSFALMERVWRTTSTSVAGIRGDSQEVVWGLRWFPFAVHHLANPLVTAYVGHPDGVNLMWNIISLQLVLLAPVTALAGPLVSYNLLITLCFALSAWTGFLAIRRHVSGFIGPFVGGLLFGFSPYMAAQGQDHANLVVTPLVPVLLMLTEDLVITPKRSAIRTGALLGLTAGAQVLVGEELFASALLMGIVLLCVLAVQHRHLVRSRLRRGIVGLSIAAPVGAAMIAGPLLVQYRASNAPPSVQVSPLNVASSLLEFVVPNPPAQLIAPWGSEWFLEIPGSNFLEHGGYIGAPLLIVVVAFVMLQRRRSLVVTAALTSLGAAILSLGPRLHIRDYTSTFSLPEALILRVPLLQNLLPSRLVLYMWLGLAYLIALLVANVTLQPTWIRRAAGALLISAALVPILPPLPYPSTALVIPQYISGNGVTELPEGSVVLNVPFPSPFAVDGMVWQEESNFRFQMPGGYFWWRDGTNQVQGSSANGRLWERVLHGTEAYSYTPALRDVLEAELHDWGVTTVILGPMNHHDQALWLITDLLGRSPEARGDLDVWLNVRVPRPDHPVETPEQVLPYQRLH